MNTVTNQDQIDSFKCLEILLDSEGRMKGKINDRLNNAS